MMRRFAAALLSVVFCAGPALAQSGLLSANQMWAGPSSGGQAFARARALVGADLPTPGASSLGGVQSLTCSSSNWFRTLSTSGILGCSQPSFTDLTGSLACAQAPALTGDVTTLAGSCATTIGNAPVIAKVLTGYVSGAGTLSAADSILSAIQKLNGNDVANAATAANAGNLTAGTLLAARMPAMTGDCTTVAGAVAVTCTKMNGVDQTTPWTPYTVTPTCTTGSATWGVTSGRFKTNGGKSVLVSIDVILTTNGASCVSPIIPLPVNAVSSGFSQTVIGQETVTSGVIFAGKILSGGSSMTLGAPGIGVGSGSHYIATGPYESQ